MDFRKLLVSALLTSSSAYAAFDNNLIQSEAASSITLAGKLGQAAMFSVQADDDSDAEIFVTASSSIDGLNDHWLLLNWTGATYEVVKRGSLQATDKQYTSGYQKDFSEIILGHEGGYITTIGFTDDPGSSEHTQTETTTFLNDLPNSLTDVELDHDVKAIVPLQGTDELDYLVICTTDYLHVLQNNELIASQNDGGYCQSGNIDYETLASNPSVYDQEVVTENGAYYTFNGTNWVQKFYVSSELGDNFKLANIDDDDADEILSQQVEQVQVFSPLTVGSWVYISALNDARLEFNTLDIDFDGVNEIFFDYSDTSVEPAQQRFSQVEWNTVADTHRRVVQTGSTYALTEARFLPTTITGGTPSNYFLFISNNEATNPQAAILNVLSADTFAAHWSGLIATAQRSAETLVKTNSTNSIDDYKLVQLEQKTEDQLFAIKYYASDDLLLESSLVPDFLDDDILNIASMSAYDFSGDGIDELHFGGSANEVDPAGIVLSSNLDGSDYSRLDTPSISEVTALFTGNVNNGGTADIMATGPEADGNGIGFHSLLDSATSNTFWFAPGSGDTSFNHLIAANIKGTDEPEILGLHTQLAAVDLNAGFLDSFVYNLSNLAFDAFTTVSLHDRDYDYAFASDSTGTVYFIEPKDFDILATQSVCDGNITALHALELNNNLNALSAVCGQSLMSWVLEYDTNNLDDGYSLYQLASHDLGNMNTEDVKLISTTTSDNSLHLFMLGSNQYKRFTIDKSISNDDDGDNYVNYKDAFPAETTQWEDSDQDGLGDNLAGADPDPSLNDIDNDGVLDSADPDNNPENDFDPSNDTDHGSPTFTSAFDNVDESATGELTTVTLTSPTAQDVYDDFNGTALSITGSVGGTALTEGTGNFSIDLAPGAHTVTWRVEDTAGNSDFETQSIHVYPEIQFAQSASSSPEGDIASIEITLSGVSPVYPFDVTVNATEQTATNGDIQEDISAALTVTFETGETSKTLDLTLVNDDTIESSETLELTLVDNFAADTWTINSAANTHGLTISDFNQAPQISFNILQGGQVVTEANHLNGIFTLNASVTDANNSDAHTYHWNLSSLGLSDSLLEDVQINPSVIEPDNYTVTLTVSDNGTPARTTIEVFNFTLAYGDSDGDGVTDDLDAFPNNPDEDTDSDGDGYGDNSDAFPDNANEHADQDNDGVGDNADQFDNNPNEAYDSDNDGVGDNADAFPQDATEQYDSDGDGVGDNADMFDDDPTEAFDSDGDGVADNADAFPFDDTETTDSDGDRVGDNKDAYPNDPSRSSRSTNDDEEETSVGALPIYLFLLLPLLMIGRRQSK